MSANVTAGTSGTGAGNGDIKLVASGAGADISLGAFTLAAQTDGIFLMATDNINITGATLTADELGFDANTLTGLGTSGDVSTLAVNLTGGGDFEFSDTGGDLTIGTVTVDGMSVSGDHDRQHHA